MDIETSKHSKAFTPITLQSILVRKPEHHTKPEGIIRKHAVVFARSIDGITKKYDLPQDAHVRRMNSVLQFMYSNMLSQNSKNTRQDEASDTDASAMLLFDKGIYKPVILKAMELGLDRETAILHTMEAAVDFQTEILEQNGKSSPAFSK